MKGLQRVFKDRTTNNLVVAFIVGFGIVNLIQGVTTWWNSGGGQTSYWTGQLYRTIIAFLVTIVVAELVSRMARN
jgi:uncharacterized membrane protein